MQARIRQTCLFAAVALGLVVALAGTALAQSSQTNVGDWKLNVAESASSGALSGTFKFEAVGDGVKVTVNTVDGNGVAFLWEASGKYDGNDNPIKGSSRNGDTVAFARVDANTTKLVLKLGGTVTVTSIYVVSADGKTMTVTRTGTNNMGNPVNNVMIYDKQ